MLDLLVTTDAEQCRGKKVEYMWNIVHGL